MTQTFVSWDTPTESLNLSRWPPWIQKRAHAQMINEVSDFTFKITLLVLKCHAVHCPMSPVRFYTWWPRGPRDPSAPVKPSFPCSKKEWELWDFQLNTATNVLETITNQNEGENIPSLPDSHNPLVSPFSCCTLGNVAGASESFISLITQSISHIFYRSKVFSNWTYNFPLLAGLTTLSMWPLHSLW